MKDILIVAHFTHIPGEKGNSRFHHLAELLSDNDVELVTTSFSHRSKSQRRIIEKKSMKYKLSLLREPGYYKNVSLQRVYSHYCFSRNVKKYLDTRKRPDIIYCSVPSLSVANVVSKYAKKHKIKLIIDIQDLWPEAFYMVTKSKITARILFSPLTNIANKVYKRADKLVAVSDTYLERASKSDRIPREGLVVYLGTQLDLIDSIKVDDKKIIQDDIFYLVYIGTLGHSYNLYSVIDALKIIEEDHNIKNIDFLIIGDGPLKDDFEIYANDKGINCVFTGRLDYEEMIKLLKLSDLAVNPIRRGSAGSIINKVGDYAAVGLPVINTQESDEYRSLVERYKIGINCKVDDSNDLADKILYLYKRDSLRLEMGNNNRKLAEEKFDRAKTYKLICSIIENS